MTRYIQCIKVKRLSPHAVLPRRAHEDDAGWDLCALESVKLYPGGRRLIPTGIAIELPDNDPHWLYEAQIRSRSGLKLRHGIVVPTATIDAGYRGDLGCIVFNLGADPYTIAQGDRIAQLVVARIPRIQLVEVEDELSSSSRGVMGFGSSGVGVSAFPTVW